MTSTNPTARIRDYRREVDFQKLGPALLIASNFVLAIRTARWSSTNSDGLANVEWEKEVEQHPHREDSSFTPDRTMSGDVSGEGCAAVVFRSESVGGWRRVIDE